MSYSFSQLEKGPNLAHVYSTFVDTGSFYSYVVQVTLFNGKRWRRIQQSFSKIERAEDHHATMVLRLTEQKGWTLKSSTCK